jgi:hypothetical protein
MTEAEKENPKKKQNQDKGTFWWCAYNLHGRGPACWTPSRGKEKPERNPRKAQEKPMRNPRTGLKTGHYIGLNEEDGSD